MRSRFDQDGMAQPPFGKLCPVMDGTQLPLQTEQGALPAVDAGNAPFALGLVEVRSRGLRPLGAGGSVDGEHGARDIGGHVAR